jgi:hypothetical protein
MVLWAMWRPDNILCLSTYPSCLEREACGLSVLPGFENLLKSIGERGTLFRSQSSGTFLKQTLSLHFYWSTLQIQASVDISTGYGLDGVRFPAGASEFYFLHSVQTGSGVHPMGSIGNAAGAWSWPLTSSSEKVKNGGVTPTPPIHRHCAVLN